MGNHGTYNGIPVTSLYTTITGTDKLADRRVTAEEEPLLLLVARVKATGKETHVPTATDAEGHPTEYQLQQVLTVVGYDLIPRKGNTVLYDDLAKRIAKAKTTREGSLAFEED